MLRECNSLLSKLLPINPFYMNERAKIDGELLTVSKVKVR
jgi:hypothetical protein